MGQGQEVHARRLVGRYIQSGGWALLQNCHLGLDFMDELLEIITETQTMHDQFRVWITTEVSFLHSSSFELMKSPDEDESEFYVL